MGRIVIACYRPKPDQGKALFQLVQMHHSILKSQGLVTNRAPILMQSTDETVVEVFEWASPEAIAAAHENPVVTEMWEQFGKVCDAVPIASVPEAKELFSEFRPVLI